MTSNPNLLDCGHPPTPTNGGGTGYGKDNDDKSFCYECCGERDRQELRDMKPGDRTIHYLCVDLDDKRPGAAIGYTVQNWPGTMKIKVDRSKQSSIRNRQAALGYVGRIDVWFTFEGRRFHGFNMGDNMVLRIRRIK